MKHRLLILVSLSALTVLMFGASLAFAHHSAAATYIHGKNVKIEGTLKEFIWRNPHSFMKVQATGSSKVLQPPSLLNKASRQMLCGLGTTSLLQGIPDVLKRTIDYCF